MKKIDFNSIEQGKISAQDYFTQYPDAEDLECVGTICPMCNKVYFPPRHFKSQQVDEIDLKTYSHWWLFRVPAS